MRGNSGDMVLIRDAAPSDIASMTTMVPRAFAPSAFLPQIIPNTALTRAWWTSTYRNALDDADCRILVAVAKSGDTVGILTLHYLGPESHASASAGVTLTVPLTPDHSPVLAKAFAGMKQERKDLMGDTPHFLIELVGVDDHYKGLGIGRRLTERACEIADQRDAAIFLQTSAARDYYTQRLRLGFREMRREEGNGSGGTVVRPRRSEREH